MGFESTIPQRNDTVFCPLALYVVFYQEEQNKSVQEKIRPQQLILELEQLLPLRDRNMSY